MDDLVESIGEALGTDYYGLREPFTAQQRDYLTRTRQFVESEVLLMHIDNKPGSLSRIAHRLSQADINIEYAYLATGGESQKGLMVLRVSGDADKALTMLQEA